MTSTTVEPEPVSRTDSAAPETDVMRAYDLLGGKQIMKRAVTNVLDAHDLIVQGIPSRSLLHLVDEVRVLSTGDALKKAIGISIRTLRRQQSNSNEKALSTEQSDRAWCFAKIMAQAKDVMGSQETAEGWLLQPAIGLSNRKPIDLLSTAVGAKAVEHYLTRLEFGVYM